MPADVELVCSEWLRPSTSALTTPSGSGKSTRASSASSVAVAGLHALLGLLHAVEAGPQVVAQLVEGVELAGRLGEVVVERRQLALLDGLHGDGDLRLLARRSRRRRALVGNSLDSPADRPAAASSRPSSSEPWPDLVGQPLGGEVVDRLAVHRRGQVDGHEVAVGRGALDAGEGGEPVAQAVELLVDLLVGDLGVVDGDLEAAVVGHLELGADVDLGGEDELRRRRRTW